MRETHDVQCSEQRYLVHASDVLARLQGQHHVSAAALKKTRRKLVWSAACRRGVSKNVRTQGMPAKPPCCRRTYG